MHNKIRIFFGNTKEFLNDDVVKKSLFALVFSFYNYTMFEKEKKLKSDIDYLKFKILKKN
jgi:hypothetical protein